MIPREQWRYLALLAEQHKTTVGALVGEIVRRRLAAVPPIVDTPAPRPIGNRISDEDVAWIESLHAQGLSDNAIRRATGLNTKTIASHRERLGLPKNVRNGRPKKETIS